MVDYDAFVVEILADNAYMLALTVYIPELSAITVLLTINA